MAARLSRYLQVLTQAKKMGKETISSQELSDYTHVNSTQIRRDLSGFGKFGKRGVGYNVEALVSQIRKILRTAGQHNIALIGAGHLGKAIASSEIFADHGFRVVAIFDSDPAKVGTQVGSQVVRHIDELRQVVEDEDIVVGVLAVPTHAAQGLADELVEAGVKIIFNYSESLLDVPPGGDRPHLQPGRRSALRAVLLSDLRSGRSGASHWTPSALTAPRRRQAMNSLDLDRAAETFAAAADLTVGVEEEFSILDPRTLDLVPRFEELRAAARGRSGCCASSITGELISSEIEIISGVGARPARRARPPARAPRGACSRSPRAHGVALGATGTHPWADYREQPIIDTEHYRRVEEGLQVRRLAQQHLQPARARRRARHRPRGARVRPPAPGAAAAAGDLRQLAVPGRARQRAALGAHAELHQELSRAAACPTRSAAGRPTASTSSSCVQTNSIVEFTQVWWSVRPHFSFGTVEVRICDAQATAQESDALAGADGRVHRAGGARRRRGRALRGSRRRG